MFHNDFFIGLVNGARRDDAPHFFNIRPFTYTLWHDICLYKDVQPIKHNIMTLTEKIQTELIGADFPGVLETENLLSDIVGRPVTWYDTVIDDGADGDETEDQYVMRACFSTDRDDIIVRVYYGDVTEEIGYVDVAETAL